MLKEINREPVLPAKKSQQVLKLGTLGYEAVAKPFRHEGHNREKIENFFKSPHKIFSRLLLKFLQVLSLSKKNLKFFESPDNYQEKVSIIFQVSSFSEENIEKFFFKSPHCQEKISRIFESLT